MTRTTLAVSIAVSTLVIIAWVAHHNAASAIAIAFVSIAGYIAGHHDGSHDRGRS
jgi:uncharacterized protein YfiM (DUF2279 family)